MDSAYDLDTEYLADGDYDTIHTDLYEPYNTDYEGDVTPTNIIPSASDGSLIFSMYAPHNTTEPASGTWDMKGLDFDTFHTFGLNNDIIQAEDGSITMPNRLDGYSYSIDNLRLPNEVANYTASDANTFPTFNTEFKYSYIVSMLDGSYSYRILADDMDNLPTSISFRALSHLLRVDYLNIDNLDHMNLMFFNCTSLTYVDVSNWDTTNINNLASMFYGCGNLNNIDVSNWNTSKVTNMNHMFYSCSSLTSLDVSNWGTGGVTNMNNMFYGCSNLTSLDLSNWDTCKVTNMSGMFQNCSSLTSLDLSGWDTGNVTIMGGMFNSCTNLKTLKGIENWDTGNVTTTFCMFCNCKNLTSLNLSGWDTGNVTTMYCMFYTCTKLTSLDVSNFDTSKVTTTELMFSNCNSLQELHIESWPLNDVTQAAVSTLPVGDDAKNIIYVTVYFTVPSGWTQDNALEIIRYTANESGVVPNLGSFTAYSLGETDNGNDTYTVQIAVDSLDNLPTSISFFGKTNLLTVEKMNTSGITTMSNMFQNCRNLTYVNTSNWNTSNVTNMSAMFYYCDKLTSLDVSNWNTSNVTNMSAMFYYCNKLTALDVSNWNTSNVTNMANMFGYCSALVDFNSPIFYISVSFEGCTALSIDSLMSIINRLASVTTEQTLTLSTTTKNNLTDEQIAIVANKGWTIG